ncbi:MAG: PilZ domain-containing protein [Nitrospira sp.]|nr:PilZ domain-containing protein [Nitrospira sp.]MDR4462819.1 PilZ domain-containing protein [Nitrospira sp.]
MQLVHQQKLTRNKARQCSRVRISMPFSCSVSSQPTRGWFRKPVHDVGLVYDLSLHGACVSTDAAIKPGDQVSLVLRLNKSTPPVEVAMATVRWTNYQFHGLAFSALSEASLKRLAEYMGLSGLAKE